MPAYVKSAGVWQLAQLYVKASGTWQLPQGSVKSSGTFQSFSSYALTVTAANFTHAGVVYMGYSNGTSSAGIFGSIAPTTIGVPAMTVAGFFDNDSFGDGIVQISGFSSNPGATYLYSATANGTTLLESAASFSYLSGVGTWSWTTQFGFAGGTSYPVRISLG